jgi:ELWxxDGT repeat protein
MLSRATTTVGAQVPTEQMRTLFLSCMIALLSFLSVSIPSYGQTPQLVDDIWSGKLPSTPLRLTVFNNKLYCGAQSLGYGYELWEWHTMGTPAKRITDLNPGTYDGTPGYQWPMGVFKGKLYFYGRATNTHTRLMDYDGVNPPGIVRTLNGGTVGPIGMTECAGKMYFVDDSAANKPGYLFSYDTGSAPVLIGKIGGVAGNSLQPLIAYKGKLYFQYQAGALGNELGSADPSTGQISLVADIKKGIDNGMPHQFTVYGDKLYFAAVDSAHGCELYSYDGTTVARLTDIQSGPANGASSPLGLGSIAGYKGAIYFGGQTSANHHALFKYDTATKAATLAYDPAPANTMGNYPACIYATPKNLYFYYNHPTTGSEIYKYNGKNGQLVADLMPGKAAGAGFSNMVLLDNYVYFSAETEGTGKELYRLSDVDNNVGIENTKWSGNAMVYPNPVSSSATLSMTLQSAQSLSIDLTDIAGRTVFTTGIKSFNPGSNAVKLPMQSLAPGQYFYRVSDNSGLLLASGAIIRP